MTPMSVLGTHGPFLDDLSYKLQSKVQFNCTTSTTDSGSTTLFCAVLADNEDILRRTVSDITSESSRVL